MKEGLVISKLSNNFEVVIDNEVFKPVPRGVLKNSGIFVGDRVVLNDDCNVIEKVLPRKNLFIRPPITNLDKLFIVLAPSPVPDMLLIDKLILFCEINHIEPVLIINKYDLINNNLSKNIETVYGKFLKVLIVSAKNNDVDIIKNHITGITAFAGQSAVGKSSILNKLFGETYAKIGDLSKKTERGKQTTRATTLYKLGQGYIADTSGFSKLSENLIEAEPHMLSRCYPDFLPYLQDCYYNNCLHKNEKNCAVKNMVDCGIIDKDRYLRYLRILENIKKR